MFRGANNRETTPAFPIRGMRALSRECGVVYLYVASKMSGLLVGAPVDPLGINIHEDSRALWFDGP